MFISVIPHLHIFNSSFTNTTQNDYSSGYWSTGNSSKQKPHNKRYSKVNVPRQPPIAPEPPPTVTLDAAKRKQLPAWIREGYNPNKP